MEIATRRYRSCAQPSTNWFARDNCSSWGIPATGVLVETLLGRGAEGDVAEAEVAIERLAAAPADDGLAIRDIWLLRLRALLARARGDDVAYKDFLSRYRMMAESLGFEGHIDWAEAMIEAGWTTARVACGSCGNGLRESARFCDECGDPIAVRVTKRSTNR